MSGIDLNQAYFTCCQAQNPHVFCQNYQLYEDGLVREKTWLSWLVFWVIDCFYDLTSHMVFAVYKRCCEEYLASVQQSPTLRALVNNKPLRERVQMAEIFLAAQGKGNWGDAFRSCIHQALDKFNLEEFQTEETRIPEAVNRWDMVPLSADLKLPLAKDDHNYPLEGLLECFDETFPVGDRSNILNDYREALEAKLLKSIHQRSIEGYTPEQSQKFNDAFYDQLIHVLRNLISELKKLTTSIQQKKEALESLGEAAVHCPPRWLEESIKQYRAVTHQGETVEARILARIQGLKEEVLYEDISRKLHALTQVNTPNFASLPPYFVANISNIGGHILNYYRISPEGKAFGLDPATAILDPFATYWFEQGKFYLEGWEQAFPATYVQDVLTQSLTPEVINEHIRDFITEEQESWPVHLQETQQYLRQKIEIVHEVRADFPQYGLSCSDYVAEAYFSWDEDDYTKGRINDRGVTRLLRELGVY